MRCVQMTLTADARPPDAGSPDAPPAVADARPDAALTPDAASTPDAPNPPDAAVAAMLGISPGDHTFAALAAGETSTAFEFTITNDGGQPTGTITATLSDDVNFSVSGTGCVGTTLAAGAQCTIAVQFTPTGEPGPRTATLTVSA